MLLTKGINMLLTKDTSLQLTGGTTTLLTGGTTKLLTEGTATLLTEGTATLLAEDTATLLTEDTTTLLTEATNTLLSEATTTLFTEGITKLIADSSFGSCCSIVSTRGNIHRPAPRVLLHAEMHCWPLVLAWGGRVVPRHLCQQHLCRWPAARQSVVVYHDFQVTRIPTGVSLSDTKDRRWDPKDESSEESNPHRRVQGSYDVSFVTTEFPLPGVGVGRPAVDALTQSSTLTSSCDCQSNAYATRSEDQQG